MITAPFNFVPLNEKVFFPDWSDNVSHDIPFEDGESGVIDITITAKSPIFVRNHSNDKDNPSSEFCNHNGEYYIPSSSVKGMVRNVLEIMSFSKMSQLDDKTYAVRDLSSADNFYMKEMKKDTFCGWLKKVDNDYIVEDCGKAGRIKHEDIDEIFNMEFSSKFKKGTFGDKSVDKTALKKYNMIDSNQFTYPFKCTSTSSVGDERYSYDENSKDKGTIVFTGQPSGRDDTSKIPTGKVYEFIFFKSKKEIKLTKKTMDNFLFAYFDSRTTEPKESSDWEYWKKKLYSGEKVPVFFQKIGNQIAHFGLSYLYKLPYKHSVKDGLTTIHFDDRLDLSQTIFGYIDKKSKKALKGRVQFSHFKAVKNASSLKEITETLGAPRPSYYPIYVKQESGKLFTTFMNNDFSISGWKRYPIQNKIQSYLAPTNKEGKINENVGTTFSPLGDGVVFQGKMYFHNLKKVELGALLSALTFHNTKNSFHNIGMAKSLGYGKIEIKLNIETEKYLKAFETKISEYIENWYQSKQLKELLSMATIQQNSGNSKLKYMELEQFAQNKTGNKNYLQNYTSLNNIKTVIVKSLIPQKDLDVLKIKQEEQKEKERVYQEGIRIDKEWKIVNNSSQITTIEAFITNYPDSKYSEKANEKIEEIKVLLFLL